MKLICGNDSADAWRKAADHLSTLAGINWTQNLLVHIDEPSVVDDSWFDLYNPKIIRSNGDALKDVANTIFPSATWATIVRRGQNRDAFYNRYKKIYERGKMIGVHASSNKRAWGTYFLRLISLGDSGVNQLETAISKLIDWAGHHHGAITFHTTTLEHDSYRVAGGPCWHFGELTYRPPNYLDFTAVYRSHDYFNKALGNFIGLGRLLSFICQHTGKVPGHLTCQSIYAWHSFSKKSLRELARL